MTAKVEGTVAKGFERAREAFAANFSREGDYQEIGASFAAFHKGRCVVDLWGGHADGKRTTPWTRDTLANVWSTTKGVTAVAMAICVERGLVRYEDKVAQHWPEFAANGKDNVTVAQVMSHQAGLPGFAEPTRVEDEYDWDSVCAKLARQKPAWAPGEATSYHAITYGFLAGEIIRRVAKKSVGRFAAEEIARPLGARLFIGLPQNEEPNVAEMAAPKRAIDMAAIPLPDAARMAVSNPNLDPLVANTRAWRAAEIPAANGQATALGLARMYGALANSGTLDGTRILKPDTIAKMTAPATRDGRKDMFLSFVDSWSMGMALNTPGIYGPNPRAYGHSGWGGSFGCADPDANVSIGYVCNQMGPDLVGDPRTEGLCAAVLACAGK